MAKLMKDQIRELDNKSAEECLSLAEILEDDKDKFDCYLRAAELGNPQGQYKTGFYYWNGFGVEADRTKAIEWYIKAAQQEHREAQVCRFADNAEHLPGFAGLDIAKQ